MLKPLPNEINGFTIIQDLGMKYPKSTSKRKRRYCFALCPACKKKNIQGVTELNIKAIKQCMSCAMRENNTTHGLSKTRLYRTWNNMKNRCENKKAIMFKNYGGRGISVGKEWENNFLVFYEWSLNNGYKEHLTIDRINNDGNYEPSNCRWVAQAVQTRNSTKLKKTNTSGHRGVTFSTNKKRYKAQIVVNYKRYYLGTFNTALEAALAYDNYVTANNLEHTKNFS